MSVKTYKMTKKDLLDYVDKLAQDYDISIDTYNDRPDVDTIFHINDNPEYVRKDEKDKNGKLVDNSTEDTPYVQIFNTSRNLRPIIKKNNSSDPVDWLMYSSEFMDIVYLNKYVVYNKQAVFIENTVRYTSTTNVLMYSDNVNNDNHISDPIDIDKFASYLFGSIKWGLDVSKGLGPDVVFDLVTNWHWHVLFVCLYMNKSHGMNVIYNVPRYKQEDSKLFDKLVGMSSKLLYQFTIEYLKYLKHSSLSEVFDKLIKRVEQLESPDHKKYMQLIKDMFPDFIAEKLTESLLL